MRKCIYYRVCNRGWRTHGSRFTHTFRTNWMMRRRGNSLAEFPSGSFDRGREQVIHEVRAVNVAILVIGYFFHHGGSKAHRQAAVDLALDDHGVDAYTAVVHCHEAADFHLTCSSVNIN